MLCFFFTMIRFDNPTSQIVNCPIIRGDTRVLFQSSSDQVNQFLQDQANKPFQIFARPGKPSQYLQDQISPRVYLSRPKNTSQNIEPFYNPPEKYEVHGVVATDVAFESELHVL